MLGWLSTCHIRGFNFNVFLVIILQIDTFLNLILKGLVLFFFPKFRKNSWIYIVFQRKK